MSQRAAQILRELQGLDIPKKVTTAFADRAEPVMEHRAAHANPHAAPHATSQAPTKAAIKTKKTVVKAAGKSWHKVAFSRENYLKDVRSNLVGSMALSIVGLCAVLGMSSAGSLSYLVPELEALQQQSQTILRLPADLKSVTDQIQAQTLRSKTLQAEQQKLVNFFPNPQQTYGTYGHFLTLLEEHKVAVTSQKGGITQTSANPLLADAANQAELLKKAQQAAAANPKAPPAPAAPKLNMLSGDIKPGLNYYHLAFTLEGSYVGYLAARQALVNENPNLVVQSESVTSVKERPNALVITTYVSIPFIDKP
jgi:hypothetical protein